MHLQHEAFIASLSALALMESRLYGAWRFSTLIQDAESRKLVMDENAAAHREIVAKMSELMQDAGETINNMDMCDEFMETFTTPVYKLLDEALKQK